MNRAELHAEAVRLRAQNRPSAQIAKMLGIGVHTVRDLINDPDGSKKRARVERYRRPCPKCGTPMNGGSGWEGERRPTLCNTCSHERQRREKPWTREAIIKAFQEFKRVNGRSPTVLESNRSPSMQRKLSPERRAEIAANPVKLPHPRTVKETFGSWAEALKAAGLPPNTTGGAAHRGGMWVEARKRKEKA